MSDPNTHINYTIEDIERYLNGGMNSKEMHDMERAALHDPFLADAIEGYSESSMQQSHQHLNEITALLQKDKQDAKVVIMPTKSFQWWRVAAMIIVIAGVGLFGWYIMNSNKSTDHAQTIAAVKEKNEPVIKETEPATVKSDTTRLIAQERSSVTENDLSKKQATSNKPVPLSRNKEMETFVKAKDADDIADTKSEMDSVQLSIASNAPGLQLSKADTGKKIFSPMQGRGAGVMNNNMTLNQFSGIVLDNNNQPVPGAIVTTGEKRSVLTDNNGYFKMLASDSLLKVSVSSVGYETANANLSLGFTNKISIEPDQQSLSEVVVSGYSSKRKDAETMKRSNSDSIFPAGGWQSFQEYVYKKMNKPFDSTNNEIFTTHGSVEIEFSVDEDGDPYNFNVVRSSGKENDEKAIQAIKEGPRWITSKKNKKNKVVIQF